jgi:F-type H+-transporting ATPase subunit b
MLKSVQYKGKLVKKLLLILLVAPIAIFASDSHSVNTDIVERTVNFIIFVSISYYVLADKAKDFFSSRANDIKSKLEQVKELKAKSEAKKNKAQEKFDNATQLAVQLVEDAKSDINSIKTTIEDNINHDIKQLSKSLDEKCDIETKKMKKEIVEEILEELMNDENISITQDNLSTIILNKVA